MKTSHLLYYQPSCPLSSWHTSPLFLQGPKVLLTLGLCICHHSWEKCSTPAPPGPQPAPHPRRPHSVSERKLHHAYKIIKPLRKCHFHTEALLTSLTRPNSLMLIHNLFSYTHSIQGTYFLNSYIRGIGEHMMYGRQVLCS